MKKISKEEAKKLGLKRYFTGEPCKHGHISERFVICSGCCECMKATDKRNRHKYYDAIMKRRRERDRKNRKKLNKRQVEYNKKNPNLREYYKLNEEFIAFNDPELHEERLRKRRIIQQRYYKNNKEKCAEKGRERRKALKEKKKIAEKTTIYSIELN